MLDNSRVKHVTCVYAVITLAKAGDGLCSSLDCVASVHCSSGWFNGGHVGSRTAQNAVGRQGKDITFALYERSLDFAGAIDGLSKHNTQQTCAFF